MKFFLKSTIFSLIFFLILELNNNIWLQVTENINIQQIFINVQ